MGTVEVHHRHEGVGRSPLWKECTMKLLVGVRLQNHGSGPMPALARPGLPPQRSNMARYGGMGKVKRHNGGWQATPNTTHTYNKVWVNHIPRFFTFSTYCYIVLYQLSFLLYRYYYYYIYIEMTYASCCRHAAFFFMFSSPLRCHTSMIIYIDCLPPFVVAITPWMLH